MAQENTAASYLNIDTDQPFVVKSALDEQENLKSKQYQDFIHTLYRFDKDNLKKVDGLFSTAGQPGGQAAGPKWTDYETSFTAPEYVAPEIPEILSNRQRRVPEYLRQRRDLVFRPLFVYRQQLHDQEIEDQHEQALRSKRHHHSQEHAYNQYRLRDNYE